MTASQKQNSGMRLATAKDVPMTSGYEWITQPAIRHLIFQAEDRLNSKGEVIAGNGLGSAIIRIGRKVLIDLDAFDQWIEQHRVKGAE